MNVKVLSIGQDNEIPYIEASITVPKDRKWVSVIGLGDTHIGHINFDEKSLRKMVSYIANKGKDTDFVILLGDTIENVIPGSKGNAFDTLIPDPMKQIEKAVEILKPISHKIFMTLSGNHEIRSVNSAGLNPSDFIAQQLGIFHVGFRGIVKFRIKCGKQEQIYEIYSEHGSGKTPLSSDSVARKLDSLVTKVVCDAYLLGHHHKKRLGQKEIYRLINGKYTKQKVILASSGAYMEDPDYAIRFGLENYDKGVAKLNFCTFKHDIHGQI